MTWSVYYGVGMLVLCCYVHCEVVWSGFLAHWFLTRLGTGRCAIWDKETILEDTAPTLLLFGTVGPRAVVASDDDDTISLSGDLYVR